MKKIVAMTFLVFLSLGTGKIWYLMKDGFSVERTQGWNIEVPTSCWDAGTDEALEQPFFYLGRGRQCFAFASQDGKYVLKLPRGDHFGLPFWLRSINIAALNKKRNQLSADRFRRQEFLLNSFFLTADELKEQTGVLAMHLSSKKIPGKTLHIKDALGRSSHLAFSDTYFILQTRKKIFKEAFLQAKTKKEKQRLVEGFFKILIERADKGILNKDGSFLRNFGFDDGAAYQIDVGSFYRNKSLSLEEARNLSIRSTVTPIQKWLSVVDPEALSIFEENLKLYL